MIEKLIFITITVSVIMTAGCETISYKKPEGFAEYKREGEKIRAISADGVVIKVYRVKNRPAGSSKMWMESVDIFMKSSGYKELSKRDVSAGNNLKGIHTEYIYRYYGRNYIYALTIFSDKEQIYLVESGGMENYYKKRRDSILASISSLKTGN